MNKKQINSHFRGVVGKWLDSIEWAKVVPDVSRTEVEQSIIISGGSIASLLKGDAVNDYDIYFNDVDICKYLVKYYINKFCDKNNVNKSFFEYHASYDDAFKGKSGYGNVGNIIINTKPPSDEVDEDDRVLVKKILRRNSRYYGENISTIKESPPGKYDPMLISNNAITLQNKIQLVFRVCGNPSVIHYFFDFKHCMNYFTFHEGVVLRPAAMESILTNELKYNRSMHVFDVLIRMKKFLSKGWTISNEELAKIMYDCHHVEMAPGSVEGMFKGHLSDKTIESLKSDWPKDRKEFFNIIDGE